MRRFLSFEQLVRTLGQLQQLDPVLNVGLVGGLVRRDVAEEAVLLGPPLGGLAVEEGGVDPAVALVQLHRVDAGCPGFQCLTRWLCHSRFAKPRISATA